MQHRLITDPPDTDRHLGAILLDLAAVGERERAAQAKFDAAASDMVVQNEISDQLAKFDDQIEQLKVEAKQAIERDTGVSFERIEEANL